MNTIFFICFIFLFSYILYLWRKCPKGTSRNYLLFQALIFATVMLVAWMDFFSYEVNIFLLVMGFFFGGILIAFAEDDKYNGTHK